MPAKPLPLTRPAWVLTGPTGSGKSAFALRLAQAHGAEIVAMDSMTLYRGMDIGTAKPSPTERTLVPHHLIDVLDPWESASVAWWLGEAERCCREIEARGRRVLFVGGTPLYLKTLLYGLFEGPPADESIRRRLELEATEIGSKSLHARLAQVDPGTAERLHVNDVRRLVRALEIWELTGRPMSVWQQEWQAEPKQPMLHCWWIDRPRDELYSRINERVEQMIAAAWIDEVRALRTLPRPLSREAGQALGYAEIGEYLDGRSDLANTIDMIQMRSRQFAKRQLTWFRHLSGLRRVEVVGECWPDPQQWTEFG